MDILVASFGDRHKLAPLIAKSVASIRKFGRNLGEIVVIGNPIAGMDGVVPFEMPPMRVGVPKHDLVLDGILKAIRAGVISDDFLYCPPGVMLYEETDLADYPIFCRRPKILSIAEMVLAGHGSAVITKYWLSMADTRLLLERNGFPTVDYSGKFLSHINAGDFPDVEALWGQEPRGEFGYEPASLFGNIRAYKTNGNTPKWRVFGR